MEQTKKRSLVKAAIAGAAAMSMLSACAHHEAAADKHACKANGSCKADMGCKAHGTCSSKPTCAQATPSKDDAKAGCAKTSDKSDKMACASKAGCLSEILRSF